MTNAEQDLSRLLQEDFDALNRDQLDVAAKACLGYESDNNWHVQAYAENVFDEFTWDGYNANGGILPSHFFGPMRPLTIGVRAAMSCD